ncbi:PREDICTED: uncharacterized protein LOC108360933 isoform X3 [Rhagoletis zephyria]|uniref:uncharacterized protein LOC108360933 isoform X3 n=1 Tax=Rhagoletis zephyria TaxID=28612 RepID=UPI0008115795|nr:PREDICTED: uncharacterized protein LOC108360933 isoform X3 [Rhagoletis zephyria]
MFSSSMTTQRLKFVEWLYTYSKCMYNVKGNINVYKICKPKRTTTKGAICSPNLMTKCNTKEPITDFEETANFKFKTLLYDENSDNVLAEINSCEDKNKLSELIKTSHHKLNHKHFIQCILVLKDLCRSIQYDSEDKLLENILHGLKPHVKAMNIAEQSCCYLYLRKFEIPNENTVVSQLLGNALEKIATTPDNPIALPALSRLAVGINTGNDFHVPSVCNHFIPHVMSHIQQCKNEDDLRLISVCLINLQPLITIDILETFKAKIDDVLKNFTIGAENQRTVLKLLHLLNHPAWSQQNGRVIRNLLLLLQPNLSKLSISDLKTTSTIFGYHLEPAALVAPLSSLMKDLIHYQHKTDLIAAYMPFLEPHQREPTVDVFKHSISTSERFPSLYDDGDFFQIIRALKISDASICDAYWSNVLTSVKSIGHKESDLRFLKHCHRYMHFNNNLGGTYRFIPLERRLCQLAMEAIENDIAARLPYKFARLASFVLAYGHTPFGWKKFPNVLLSKIISMSSQFSVKDCFYLSRGIHIALELRFRNTTSSLLVMQLATLDSVLTDCVARHLENNSLSIFDLNTIVRTLGYRKSFKNKTIYYEALDRYKQLDYKEINSRTIREMAFNFNAANCSVPIALEAMFRYIEHHHEVVIGDTVEKVLTCAYNLGYAPQSNTALYNAALVLKRVAILLLRLDSYCENDLTAMRGAEHLRTKHLEMMGYKVLHINEHDWNTRYMNSPQIKTNYLKCLLQI